MLANLSSFAWCEGGGLVDAGGEVRVVELGFDGGGFPLEGFEVEFGLLDHGVEVLKFGGEFVVFTLVSWWLRRGR